MKISAKLFVLFILIWFIFPQDLCSYAHFSDEEGLTQNFITAIHQDQQGFIWIGTIKGLNRYDGSKFRNYFASSDSTGLQNDYINNLMADSTGIFILTTQSIEYYDFYLNEFSDFGKQNNRFRGNFRNIIKDHNNNFWIEHNAELMRIDNHGNVLQTINLYDIDKNLPDLKIMNMIYSSNHDFWLATFQNGLIRFNMENNQIEHFRHTPNDSTTIAFNRVQVVFEDSHHNIWAGTWRNGLNRYDRESRSFRHYTSKDGLSNEQIESIGELDSQLYIGTWGGGINIFDTEKEKFVQNEYNFANLQNISGKQIKPIFKDIQGNLWAGTINHGLYCLYNYQKKFRRYNLPGFNHLQQNNAIKQIMIYDGIHYLCTSEHGLIIHNPKTSSIEFLNSETIPGFPSDYITGILKIEDQLWLASYSGLINYDIKTREIDHFLINEGKNPSKNIIYDMEIESDSTFLFSNQNLYRFNCNRKDWEKINNSTIEGTIWQLHRFLDKWVLGTPNHGVYILNDKFETEFQFNQKHEILKTNHIYDIDIGSEKIWLGTNNGIFFIDHAFKIHRLNHELLNNFTHLDIISMNDELWSGTSKGLLRYNKTNQRLQYYGRDDNLSNLSFEWDGSCTYNNKIYMVNSAGIISFDPTEITEDSLHSKTIITDFNIINTMTTDKTKKHTLHQPWVKNQEIHLKYNDVFSIEFSFLNFIHPDKNQFAYQLAGLDNDWNYINQTRKVIYNHLPPGKFMFIVKGANSDGIWDTMPATLQIIIAPPFWETRFFKITAVLAVFLIALGIYNYRTSMHHQREQFLKETNYKLKKEIIERQAVEDDLTATNNLLNSIMNASRDVAIISTNKEGLITYFNKGAELLLEYPAKEIVGKKNILHFQKTDPGPAITGEHNLTLTDFSDKNFMSKFDGHSVQQWNCVTKSGKIKTVRLFISEIKGKGSGTRGYLGVAIDITESMLIKQELEKTKDFIDSIINSMPSKIISITSDGIITHINRQMEKELTDIDTQLIHQNIYKIFPDFKIYREKIAACIKENRTMSWHKQKRALKDKIIIENIVIYPLFFEQQEGAVIRIDDVTEQVKIEEVMIQSEKMMSIGGLAAGMAHEINNPLAGMIQNATVIQNRLFKKLPKNVEMADSLNISLEKITQYMEMRNITKQLQLILDAGKRASEIVQNMLSFARQNSSNYSYENPAEIMDQTIKLAKSDYDMKKQYDFRKIKVIKRYAPDLPVIKCEKSKLQQVFLNILKNGAEAMHAENQERTTSGRKPKVSSFLIKIYYENNECVYEIQDNGPGMTENIKNRIFEPFFTTKGSEKGTGLGLSVSYFIITDNHQGKLFVESEINIGTKFIIALPLQKEENAA